MYPIDLATCTMLDVIKRSAVCHPSLLCDALRKAHSTHSHYSTITHNKAAARSAVNMAAACLHAIQFIEENDLDAFALILSPRVIAFSAALKLQCIPYATGSDIAERDDAARKAA